MPDTGAVTAPGAPLSRRTALAVLGSSLAGAVLASCATPEPLHGSRPSRAELIERYAPLGLTDVHNHGASRGVGTALWTLWDEFALRRVVLFGSVASPRAVADDERTWRAFQERPDLVVPFFSGFDPREGSAVDVVRARLDQGFAGVGEVAGASRFSEALAQTPWKTQHPLDGFLPEIYDVCAEYAAPVLLHVDPLSGPTLARFEEALDAHPRTTFIVAHVNAYTPPSTAAALLADHPNLYADFFAGFTEHSEASEHALEDFVEVAREFPDRWLLGSDSGYGLDDEGLALESMYRFLHLLGDDAVARGIAFGNFDRILAARPGD